jgi:hypothetical protein
LQLELRQAKSSKDNENARPIDSVLRPVSTDTNTNDSDHIKSLKRIDRVAISPKRQKSVKPIGFPPVSSSASIESQKSKDSSPPPVSLSPQPSKFVTPAALSVFSNPKKPADSSSPGSRGSGKFSTPVHHQAASPSTSVVTSCKPNDPSPGSKSVKPSDDHHVGPASPPSGQALTPVNCPISEGTSLEGIISYLTQRHGGNVHEKGVVIMTSKTACRDPRYALKNAADLTSASHFMSRCIPGQWVCWDFRELRIRPTHYTIKSAWLTSWEVSGSLDGTTWTELDRQNEVTNFKDGFETASFAIATAVECRFLRLIQTEERKGGNDYLVLKAFEIFGTLFESGTER